MKKSFIFSLLAIFLAGLGLGGVSMAAAANVAKIGETEYETLSGAINAANSGETITLISSFTSNDFFVPADKNITLDLNGKILSLYNTTSPCAGDLIDGTCYNYIYGNLTIKDSVGGGKIVGNDAGIMPRLGGKLIITNGSYEQSYYLFYLGGGELIINDGNFIGPDNIINCYADGDFPLGGEITINSGTFEVTDIIDNGYEVVPVMGFENCNININGGKFTSHPPVGVAFRVGKGTLNPSVVADHAVAVINGGEFNGPVVVNDDAELIIKGGTFSDDPSDFLEDGYTAVQEGGKWIIVGPVAAIGEHKYSTITGAIVAANEGDTVEILKAGTYAFPTTISKNITIEGTREVVLDASGATSVTSIASIPNGATFSGVTVKFPDSTSPVEFGFYEAGNIEFDNCKIEGRFYTYGNTIYKNCELVGKGYPVTIYRGNVTFDGCTIESKDNTNGGYYLNAYNKGIAASSDHSKVEGPYTITIKDTTFKNSNTNHNDAKEKSAINIHEYYPNTKTILGYNVVMTNITLEGGNFPTKWYGGSEKWMIGDIMSDADTINGDPLSGDVNYGTENGGEIKVTVDGTTVYSTPKRGQIWTVTFDGTGAKEVADGAKVEKPANPAAQGCKSFVEWQLNGVAYDFNSVVTGNLALTSKWSTSSCGGGGGGGTTTTTTTGATTTGDINTGDVNTGADTSTVDSQAVQTNGYTNEMNAAYEFAYANGITTMKTIDEAEMFDGLTRIAMAKMLSQYAINVLGKSPADVVVPNFIDVSADLNAEYDNGVTLAYKLGIMGINMPGNKFLPFEYVTRAQFGTALSRLLFGIEDGEDAYYTTHLAKLKEAGIITNDDPTLEELRGYVMLMLYRSANDTNAVNNTSEGVVSNENTNKPVNESSVQEQEVEKYFTEAYRKGQIYGRIGDLQRLLQSLGFYNGDINNTFDNNTINAVFDFQIAMGILSADDTSASRGNVGPKTREILNQKWAEFQGK